MANALSKIRARAKAIRSKHPKKSYQSALKEAGRDYRAGKISGVKKKKTTVKRKTPIKRKSRVGAILADGMSVSQQERVLRKGLETKLGAKLVAIEGTKKITEKKKLRKEANEIRKKLKALR